MLTLKQIDARITRLTGRYTKINDDVQEILVSIVHHANETGDCDRARKVVRALPSRMRSLAIFWFTNVSPINVTIGKTVVDDKARLRKEDQRNYNAFNLDMARANVWHTNPFELPKDTSLETALTYTESLERLFDRMERNTKDGADKIEPDAVDTVKALRAHMRAAYIAFTQIVDVPTQDNEAPEADVMQQLTA